jgi:hemolysin III
MSQKLSTEELANGITHAVALLFSVFGVVLLFAHLGFEKGPACWISVSIYSISLIALYSASTIYHFVTSPSWKPFWRIVDHSAIYIKIAGTYTPFLVLAISGTYGWVVLVVMWCLTATGIIFKTFFTGRFNILSTILYLAMGWMALGMISPLYHSVSLPIFIYLMAGGVSFTLGVAFYLWEKLPYNHSVWHAFVAGGSALHYVSIYLLISQ